LVGAGWQSVAETFVSGLLKGGGGSLGFGGGDREGNPFSLRVRGKQGEGEKWGFGNSTNKADRSPRSRLTVLQKRLRA